MKQLKNLIIPKTILIILILFNFNIKSFIAQDIGIQNRPRITNVNRKPSANSNLSGKRSVERIQVIVKPIYVTKEKTKYVKTNPTGLSVTTTPFANITLEPISPGKGIKRDKSDDKGVIIFENLDVGKYKLSVSLEGYQPQESEVIIRSQKIATIPITLKKVTYDFSIQTNVDEGEVRFAPVKILGQNSDGTLNVEETGGYCVVPIKKRKAKIQELPEGTYNIDVRAPNAPEFEPKLAVIKIPDDTPDIKNNDLDNIEPFRIDLDNKLSTGTFNQFSSQSAWKLPENWKINNNGIKVCEKGIALLKDQSFRYYKNFEMQSSVRLLNNSSLGFVFRAIDENNYYLIQLTGSDSKEPYMVLGTVINDGRAATRVLANPISHLLKKTFIAQKYFTVIVKAKGNLFEIFVEDSETGNILPLGNAEFKDNNFPIGAVGLSGIDKSSFEVGSYTVCYEICK